jgi:hypothetical protein
MQQKTQSSFLQTLQSSPSQKWFQHQNQFKNTAYLTPISENKLNNKRSASNKPQLNMHNTLSSQVDPEKALQEFYSHTYLSPTRSLAHLPSKADDRLKKIKSISTLKSHELEQTYQQVSLPVLREIKSMKRNWGNERTAPDYQISKHERVYRSMLESCMVLDNNKKIHCDIEGEMTATYKGKLD